jgi:CheY-like chemotaxis protein
MHDAEVYKEKLENAQMAVEIVSKNTENRVMFDTLQKRKALLDEKGMENQVLDSILQKQKADQDIIRKNFDAVTLDFNQNALTLTRLMEQLAQAKKDNLSRERQQRIMDAMTKLFAARNKTILWIDDKPENNAIVADYLRGQGYTVDTCLSMGGAMSALITGAEKYSLIISNLECAESGTNATWNGGDLLLDQLSSKGIRKPIIFYSPNPDVPVRAKLEKKGKIVTGDVNKVLEWIRDPS